MGGLLGNGFLGDALIGDALLGDALLGHGLLGNLGCHGTHPQAHDCHIPLFLGDGHGDLQLLAGGQCVGIFREGDLQVGDREQCTSLAALVLDDQNALVVVGQLVVAVGGSIQMIGSDIRCIAVLIQVIDLVGDILVVLGLQRHVDICNDALAVLDSIISFMESERLRFIETKDKAHWWQMIQLLPSSYNQKRTVQLNYEVLANIYKSRKNHKLDEWHTFCDWVKELPYSFLITGEEE